MNFKEKSIRPDSLMKKADFFVLKQNSEGAHVEAVSAPNT